MSSHNDLMIGTISLSSIHLILSLVLFLVLLSKPTIVTQDYIKIFLGISMFVNLIVFFLCYKCKESNSSQGRHNNLMFGCMAFSLIHFILSGLMLNYTSDTILIILFLNVSIVVNGIIIYLSNNCKNLELVINKS